MVTRSYLLEKPNGPSATLRYLHWNAVPPVINALGAIEGQLEHVAVSVRQSPARALTAALTFGLVLGLLPRRRTI